MAAMPDVSVSDAISAAESPRNSALAFSMICRRDSIAPFSSVVAMFSSRPLSSVTFIPVPAVVIIRRIDVPARDPFIPMFACSPSISSTSSAEKSIELAIGAVYPKAIVRSDISALDPIAAAAKISAKCVAPDGWMPNALV